MSRIGKQILAVDPAVKISAEKGGIYGGFYVTVEGPKGKLELDVRRGIEILFDEATRELKVAVTNDSKEARAFHGLYRSLIENMTIGVKDGYSKKLEIHGVGYRAKSVGRDLELSLGYTHSIPFKAPEGIEFEIIKEVDIIVKGIDKQAVGETAAKIRELRKPEPYKGKGIRYEGEYVRRKVGKAMAK